MAVQVENKFSYDIHLAGRLTMPVMYYYCILHFVTGDNLAYCQIQYHSQINQIIVEMPFEIKYCLEIHVKFYPDRSSGFRVNMDELTPGQSYKLCVSGESTQMSLVLRKPAFCICENKDADQLCGNRTADQRLCFRYTDSTIPLLPKSKITSP